MGNMSYCRFRNTLEALRDCRDFWDEKGEDEIGHEEFMAKRKLLCLCREIVSNFREER